MRKLREFEEIAQTKDLMKAIRLARGLDSDWSVIHVDGHGYIWISQSDTIVWAETEQPSASPYKALLNLLAVESGNLYSVGESFVEPPARPNWIEVSLKDIQRDIVTLAEKLRDLADTSDDTQDVKALCERWNADQDTTTDGISFAVPDLSDINQAAFEKIRSLHENQKQAKQSSTTPTEDDVADGGNVQNLLPPATEAGDAQATNAENEGPAAGDLAQKEILALFSTAELEAQEFYGPVDLRMQEDDQQEKIQADLKELGSLLAEPPQRFYDESNNLKTDDDETSEKRKAEYELLKEFVAEPDDKFHEKTEFADEPDSSMTEFQMKVLDLVQEMQDPESFAEQDDKLKNEVLLPNSVEGPQEPQELPAAPVVATAELQDTRKPDVNQPDAGKQSLLEKDDRTLITRPGSNLNSVGAQLPPRKVMPPMSQGQIAACIGAALTMVLLVVSAIRGASEASQAAAQDRRTVAALIESTADEEGLSSKPRTAQFRLPEGGTSQGSSNSAGSGSSGANSDEAVSDDVGQYEFQPQAHPVTPPTSLELAEAERAMRQGDALAAQGNYAQAVQVYGSALERCPASMPLRVALVKSYAALHQIRQARAICVAGMKQAATEEDFNTLYALLRTLR